MGARGGPWLVWSVGVFAYLVAVLQRSSFGVAGLAAAERFHIAPVALSAFVVLQLVVYTSLQVPVGLLLDRFGARRLILAGGLVMTVGQLLLAVASALPLAYLARVLVGVGDALTFISVLRVVNSWFPPRRAPLMTQLTALIGQLGQVLSAVPLALLLHSSGWTAAFGSAAAMGALAVVLVIAVVAERPVPAPATGRPGESGGRPGAAAEPGERPGDAEPGGRPPLAEVLRGLRAAWATPGTRLGFYTHMGTQFSGTVFSLLWGVPFLVAGQGLRPAQASGLLTVLVLAGIVAAPVVGELTARHPLRRSWLVLTVIGLTAAVWTVVLALPPPVPYWLLVVLVVTLALGAPGSIVGFDYARTFNPTGRQGTAVGIVNSGGFSASVVVVLVVGVLLGVVGGPEGYTGQAFRVAWCVQYLVWIFATVGVLRTRRAARRQLAEEDGIVVPPLREALARRRGTGPGR